MFENVDFLYHVCCGYDGCRPISMNVFTPRKIPSKPRPAIVFVHGGGWKCGNLGQFTYFSSCLAKKYGFYAANVDYRMSGEAKFPTALQDIKCAVRYIRANTEVLNIAPKQIVIAGSSSGAHLASLVAATAGIKEYEGNCGNPEYSSHVDLAILINGIFDLWDLVKKNSIVEDMRRFIGGTPKEYPAKYDELSSIQRIHNDMPPILLLHGTNDKCVSHQQSISFYNRLRELDVHAEIELYQGKPHGWFNLEPERTITLRRIEKFLVSQLAL